jgi:hypothetical protein
MNKAISSPILITSMKCSYQAFDTIFHVRTARIVQDSKGKSPLFIICVDFTDMEYTKAAQQYKHKSTQF